MPRNSSTPSRYKRCHEFTILRSSGTVQVYTNHFDGGTRVVVTEPGSERYFGIVQPTLPFPTKVECTETKCMMQLH